MDTFIDLFNIVLLIKKLVILNVNVLAMDTNVPNMKLLIMFLTDVNECVDEPCKNGGTCIDEFNEYICNCASGYTGINCETGKL